MKLFLKMTALVAVLSAAVFFYALRRAPDAPALAEAEKTDIVESVYATGAVEPVVFAEVSPQMSVRLEEILVREGDPVQKGQKLAKADDTVEVSQLRQYQSHLAELKNSLERNRALKMKGFSTAEKLEAAQSDYKETLSRIDSQQKLIDRMSIAAPIGGVVLRRDAEPGEVKAPGQVIFVVGQPENLRITADVDEEDILRVAPGQRALIKSDALPGVALEGTVDAITPKGDSVNKNFRVRIALPATTPLRIGMTAEVNIVIAHRSGALAVPAAAVRDGHVLKWRNGRTEKAAVVTGLSDGKNAEILEGLSEGDMILRDYP